MPRSPSFRALIVLAALTALPMAACSSSPHRVPTGSECPPGSTLTYDNFGEPFMTAYCTRCHDSSRQGADRHGAPLYHDFDTLVGILNVAGHVDELAAAGPDSVNEQMPFDGAQPTLDERYQLGEWLACELERLDNPADAGADASGAADAGTDAP